MSEGYSLPEVNPLNKSHLEDINKALSFIEIGLKQAALASRAGVDVTPQVEQFDTMKKKLQSIKQVYFPNE